MLNAVNRILTATIRCESEEELARKSLEVAEWLTDSKFGWISELNERGRLDSIAISDPGWSACRMPKSHAVSLINDIEIRGIWGEVIRKGTSLITNDPASHPASVGLPEGHPLLTCYLGVPLKRGEEILGMVSVANKAGGYSEDDRQALEELSFAIVEALHHARSENLHRTLVETSLDAIIMLNPKGVVIQSNQQGACIFGVSSSEELVGKSLRDYLQPNARQRFTEHLKEALEVKTRKPAEFCFVGADGRSRLGEMRSTVITDDADNPRAIMSIIRDVTERRTLEGQLLQAQKLESIGGLAAGIAHEINTPMQYIGDNTRFLQNSCKDILEVIERYDTLRVAIDAGSVTPALLKSVDEAIEEADLEFVIEELPKSIDQSLEGLDRVSEIVRSMKEFSHPGSETKILFNINKGIETTVTISRNEWKYMADVTVDLDPELPLVPCLPGEFNQVILNTVVNAAHAIEKKAEQTGDEEKGNISITTRQDGDFVEIHISDTGCGIPKSIEKRVFDPFFPTKEVGKGTGQGLALAHTTIVEKHGGELTLKSKEGEGTTFTIRLPLNAEETPAGDTA